MKQYPQQQSDQIGLGPVPRLHVVAEAAVKELIVDDSEGDLTGGTGSQEEGDERVAQDGTSPDQREYEGSEDEVLHVYRHVPGDVHTVRLPTTVDVSSEVVDVEKVEPPTRPALVDQGRHQVGLGSAGGKLQESGVESNDDGVDPGQTDISVDIEHHPHPSVPSSGLVQLLHRVEGQQTSSDHKESVHSKQRVPQDSGRHVVRDLGSGLGAEREGSVAADVTVLPENVAEDYPRDGNILDAVDTGEVSTGSSSVENLLAVVISRESLQEPQVLFGQILDLQHIDTNVQHGSSQDQEAEGDEEGDDDIVCSLQPCLVLRGVMTGEYQGGEVGGQVVQAESLTDEEVPASSTDILLGALSRQTLAHLVDTRTQQRIQRLPLSWPLS